MHYKQNAFVSIFSNIQFYIPEHLRWFSHFSPNKIQSQNHFRQKKKVSLILQRRRIFSICLISSLGTLLSEGRKAVSYQHKVPEVLKHNEELIEFGWGCAAFLFCFNQWRVFGKISLSSNKVTQSSFNFRDTKES